MTFDDAVTILKAALASGFNTYPVIYEEGGGRLLDSPAGRVEVGFRMIAGDQRSIGAPGANSHEEEGAMIAYVFVPSQQPGSGVDGDAAARQACEAISAVFRGKDLSGVEILHIGGDDGGGTTQDGNWWRRWRRIEFRYQMLA